jgi:hypothetical protein
METANAAPSLKTRAPDQSREQDRDENGTIDAYWEKFKFEDGLTIETYDRLEESSGKLRGRMTFIKLNDAIVWSESYLPSLRERDITVERHSPFNISTTIHEKTRKATVTLIGDNARLVAILVREKDGRLTPVTAEELDRLRSLGQAVSEFARGVLDNPEELEASRAKRSEHLRKLDEAVSEYTQSGNDQTRGPTDSEGNTK